MEKTITEEHVDTFLVEFDPDEVHVLITESTRMSEPFPAALLEQRMKLSSPNVDIPFLHHGPVCVTERR